MSTKTLTTSQDIYGDHVPRNIDEWYADLATDVWDAQKRMWKISHKLAWGENEYEDEIYQYLDRLPFSAGYLANLKTLGSNFPPSRRRELTEKGFPEFPLSYYQELCSLTPGEQEQIMHAIVEDNLKREDIRKLKRQVGQRFPRSPWEIACENDALTNENSDLRNHNGRLERENQSLRDTITAREQRLAQARRSGEETEGDEDDAVYEQVMDTIICPECGAIIEL